VAVDLPVWSNEKYEFFFFELLKGVCEQGWDRDAVLAHLAKRSDLIIWLKRFGKDRLQDTKQHKELAEKMAKLEEIDDGEFCQEVKRIVRELLVKPEVEILTSNVLEKPVIDIKTDNQNYEQYFK